MRRSDTLKLLAAVDCHHGYPPRTKDERDMEVRMWTAELDPSLTLDEAMRAVAEYYSRTAAGWCKAGDVNALAREARRASLPSEGQVSRWLRDAEARGLYEGVSAAGGVARELAWRRELLRELRLGAGPGEACEGAFRVAVGLGAAPERRALGAASDGRNRKNGSRNG